MSNEDQTIWVVFNGEIYNYRKLRADLEARGHRFVTNSDTETIVHCYEEYGLETPSRLRGEFAFAVYDTRDGTLFAARDRLGVKPLYYYPGPGRFLMASEPRAILAHDLVPCRPFPPAIWDYMCLYSPTAPTTPFLGIYKLPAANAVLVSNSGEFRVFRYWTPLAEVPYKIDEAEAADEVLRLFRQSTEDRMLSEVGVGAFLSGGVDSGANVGVMSEFLAGPVRTFTVGYSSDSAMNEFAGARETAARFNTIHAELTIGPKEFWEAVTELPKFMDEPNANAECIPLFHLSRFTRRHGVTVVQVGEGADELFGYPSWKDFLTIIRVLRMASRRARTTTRLAASVTALLLQLTGRPVLQQIIARHARGFREFPGGAIQFHPGTRAKLAGPLMRSSIDSDRLDHTIEGWYDEADQLLGGLREYQEFIWIEMQHRLPEHLLARVDRTTMASGVEARVPFLDHRLVEFVFGLPEELRFRSGPKGLLRKAVRGRVLPQEFVDRPKVAFSTPVEKWLANECYQEARSTILNSCLFRDDILSRSNVLECLDRWPQDVRNGRRRRISPYPLLVLSRWYDQWFK